jgi:hypothetical protein
MWIKIYCNSNKTHRLINLDKIESFRQEGKLYIRFISSEREYNGLYNTNEERNIEFERIENLLISKERNTP